MYPSDQNGNKRITGAVFLKVTLQAGSPAGRLTLQEEKFECNKKLLFQTETQHSPIFFDTSRHRLDFFVAPASRRLLAFI
jgi:hypothetical protein